MSLSNPLQSVQTKTKIAIVGGAQSWVDAPFDDDSWEIWVLGNQLSQYEDRRIDLVFEIHDNFDNRPVGFPDWLVGHKHNMVVGEKFGIENDQIEIFDYGKAKELMGGTFLTSTPSFQTAYALYSRPDVEEIGYWGVDMAVDDTEYFYEQPCLNRWMGFCRGRGIKITLPEGCPLGEPAYIEGVTANHPESNPPFSEADFKELAERHQVLMDDCDAQIKTILQNKAQHDGAKQIYLKLLQVARAVDGGQKLGSLMQTLRTF